MPSTIPTDRNYVSPMGNLPTAVAIGAVPGWTGFRKFGRNDDVDGNEEMWEIGTARVLPTSAGALSVVSSSAEDDPDEATPPGTGAWTIVVEGLDSNYDEISETITMSGVTPVASVSSDWFRVNRAYNVTAGSNEVNVGNITIAIGGDTQAYIEANEGQTHQTHYTVPAGKTLLVTGFALAAGTLGNAHMVVESQIRANTADAAWRTISALDLVDGETFVSSPVWAGEILPEKWEIRQKLIFTGTNGEIAGEWYGYLMDNSTQGNFG